MCSSECTTRVVVLTGGAQGIGRSCMEAFLQRGDKVGQQPRDVDPMVY